MNEPNNPITSPTSLSSSEDGGTLRELNSFRQALTVAQIISLHFYGLAESDADSGRGHGSSGDAQHWGWNQIFSGRSRRTGMASARDGQYSGSSESLQHGPAINPNPLAALAHMGQFYEEMGRPFRRSQCIRTSLRSDWNQPDVHSRLAAVSQQAGASSRVSNSHGSRSSSYSVARQPSLMGPPSAGSQMAQMQIQQNQWRPE